MEPSAEAIALVADSLASAPSPVGRRARVVRALVRAGVTPLADMGRREAQNPRFVVDGPVTAGLIPGRNPLARDELVVVATAIDGPQAAVVLEAARVMAERAKWTTNPERTVMIAFLGPGASVNQVLNAGVWPRAQVRAVLTVGDGGRVPEGVSETALVLQGRTPQELASTVLEAALRLARRPPPAADSLAADTTSAP